LTKGALKQAKLALPIEHLAMQCFPVLISSSHDCADDFPFAEDSGLQLQTIALPFNDSQVVAMAGNAMICSSAWP
jgi:hypothetical protein